MIVQIISAIGIANVHLVVLVPVARPGFRPWIKHTEPVAIALKTGISAKNYQREAIDAEPVPRTKVAIKTSWRNTVAIVTATLLPGAVLGLPVTCAMLLPHGRLYGRLHPLPAR